MKELFKVPISGSLWIIAVKVIHKENLVPTFNSFPLAVEAQNGPCERTCRLIFPPFFSCILDIGLISTTFKLLKFTESVSREEPYMNDVTGRDSFRGDRKDLCSPGAGILT